MIVKDVLNMILGSAKRNSMQVSDAISTPMNEDDGPDFATIELLFFAYRNFISDADEILKDYGFGRVHHRVLHCVNRQPGQTVAHLLEILDTTKQSFGRVLRQLVSSGHIVQQPRPDDRRQRLLYPTQKGRNLALQLSEIQSQRISEATINMSEADEIAIHTFLTNLVDKEGQERIMELRKSASFKSKAKFQDERAD